MIKKKISFKSHKLLLLEMGEITTIPSSYIKRITEDHYGNLYDNNFSILNGTHKFFERYCKGSFMKRLSEQFYLY